jgi:peptidyl-prolyl cis-trans isomerase A (cyclophilin A)
MKKLKLSVCWSVCLMVLGSSAFAVEEKKVEKSAEKSAEKSKKEVISKKEMPKAALPKEVMATLKTSMGTIQLKLFAAKAPLTVENFIGLSTGKKAWTDPKTGKEVKNKSLYAGTVFHRIIPDFMIQGGDPLGKGTGGPGYQFADEFSPLDSFDKPGILAMANAGPGTNGSQFFITVKPTPWLNGKHTLFGEVTKGMDVVNKIVSAERGEMDRPKKDIKIISISVK